jgi:aerobic-type carbon monoxide dehydrogenase small subunit (CoxS/CutS family)
MQAAGKKITTVEGLANDAVPKAFVECDAQQCGFCTPGFVVSMVAAFEANPNASPGQIEAALSGNICRCGTYEQMRDAIADLCKVQRKKEG